jgi:hypothetical protein
MVVPGSFGHGWKVGAWDSFNELTDNMFALLATWAHDHVGEVSILLGRCLGLNYDPKKGGSKRRHCLRGLSDSDPVYRPWRRNARSPGRFSISGAEWRLKELMQRNVKLKVSGNLERGDPEVASDSI